MKSRSRNRREWVIQALDENEKNLLIYSARLLGGDFDCARDVVQDAFLRLCRQPRIKVDGHVKQWLFTVCRNRCCEMLRKEKRMKPLDDAHLDRLSSGNQHPAEGLQREEELGTVRKIISCLPDRQQEVVRLKFQAGMSYKEISGITSLSVSHVGVILHEAVRTIRKEMTLAARPGVSA